MRRSILFAGIASPDKKSERYVPWVEIYAVLPKNLNCQSGIVTAKSGNLPQSVTFGRIRRSRSTGSTGHVRRIRRSRCAGIPILSWYIRGQGGSAVSTDAFAAALERFGGRGRVVMVDGASDTYAANENDRAQVKAFIRYLRHMIAPDGALLLLAHVDKLGARAGADAHGFSGSTGWHNSVRARWFMFSELDDDEAGGGRETGRVMVEVRKNNLGRAGAFLALRFDDTSGTFERDNTGHEGEKLFQRVDESTAVLAVLRAAWEAGNPIPAATSGSRTAHSVAEAYETLPASLKGRTGRKRFNRTVERLRAAGTVRVEAIKRPNRHATEVLKCD